MAGLDSRVCMAIEVRLQGLSWGDQMQCSGQSGGTQSGGGRGVVGADYRQHDRLCVRDTHIMFFKLPGIMLCSNSYIAPSQLCSLFCTYYALNNIISQLLTY